MSHFSVAVFTESGGKSVEELLAPYQENNMGDCPKEYLEFHCVEEEYKKNYETDTVERVRMPDGRLLPTYAEEFRIPGEIGIGSSTHKVPEELSIVNVTVKELYPDFDAYMKDYCGYEEKDQETSKYGYWENPNKKWDWWQVGGRYSGGLIPKQGTIKRSNSALLKDIDFDSILQKSIIDHENWWKEAQDKPDVLRFFEYGISKDMTYEQYLKSACGFLTFAVVLPDGKWYEKGQMGWWACVSNEEVEWDEKFKERFIDSANPEWTITVVDCHI